jgi:hypothetical protein
MTIPSTGLQGPVLDVMIATFEGLLVFLLFLPGFISQRIIELLTPRRPRGTLMRIIDGAALSILVYLLYLVVAAIFCLPVLPISRSVDGGIEANLAPSLAILLLSVASGLILGKGLEFGWIYKILRADYLPRPLTTDESRRARVFRKMRSLLRFTRSTGRNTVWEDVLSIQRTPMIAVTLKDGRKIVGSCRFFSDDPDRPEIVIVPPDPEIVTEEELRGVIVFEKDGSRSKLPGGGVFITSSAGIDVIELLGGNVVES